MEHTGSFKKYGNSPVFGNLETGTMFDAYVWKQNDRLRMDISWRPKQALAVSFSDDGIHWEKYVQNPMFRCAPENEYEQNRIGAVQLLKEDDGYLMFYIGYRDINTACICAARSKDGITGWQRVPENPLVMPTPGGWDEDSCYKPTVVRDEDGLYHLWYNGRRESYEYIGYASGRIEK